MQATGAAQANYEVSAETTTRVHVYGVVLDELVETDTLSPADVLLLTMRALALASSAAGAAWPRVHVLRLTE